MDEKRKSIKGKILSVAQRVIHQDLVMPNCQ